MISQDTIKDSEIYPSDRYIIDDEGSFHKNINSILSKSLMTINNDLEKSMTKNEVYTLSINQKPADFTKMKNDNSLPLKTDKKLDFKKKSNKNQNLKPIKELETEIQKSVQTEKKSVKQYEIKISKISKNQVRRIESRPTKFIDPKDLLKLKFDKNPEPEQYEEESNQQNEIDFLQVNQTKRVIYQ
jgi:hypothetical protein